MAELYFKVKSDWEEVVRLRQQIQGLKSDLKKMDSDMKPESVKALESQLSECIKRYTELIENAAKAGAEMELAARNMLKASEEILNVQDRIIQSTQQQQGAETKASQEKVISLREQAKAYEQIKSGVESVTGSAYQNAKSIGQTSQALRIVDDDIKRLNKQIGDGTPTKEQSERLAKLTIERQKLRNEISEYSRHLSNEIKILQTASGSMDEMSQKLGLMRTAYRAMSEEQRNSTMGKELLATIQQTDAKLKELDATIGNHQRNVGNYGSSLTSLIQQAQGIPGPIGQAASSVNGLTKASLRFIATPVGMVLAALSAALMLVTSWFNRTEEGQNALAVSSAYFKQILESILDVADDIGEWLYKAFTTPKEAVKELGRLLKANIVDVLKVAGQAALGLTQIMSGNLIQGGKMLVNAFKDSGVANSISNVNQKAKERMKIADEQNALDKQERENLVERAKIEAKIAALREKAYDMSVSEKDRSAAIKQASRLTKKMYDDEIKLARKRYEIIKNTNSLSHSDKEAKRREAEAEARLYQLESQRDTAMRGLLRQSNRLTSASNSADRKAQQEAIRQARAEEKRTDIQNKQQLTEERAARDLAFSTREAEIKAMEDGTAKILAQIELDKDKEEDAIERAYEDMRLKRVEAAKKMWDADPKNKGKDFYKSSQYQEANVNTQAEDTNREERLKAALKTYNDALEEQRRAEVQSMYDYLQQYGTYQQKKLAIAEEYAQKIAEANKKGDTWTAKKLEAESKSKQQAVDTQALKQNIDWQAVLGGFTNMLGEQLKNTLSNLKEYVKTPEFAQKNESDQQVVYQAIEKLNGLVGGGNGTLDFSKIKAQMDDLGAAVNRLQQAKNAEYTAYGNLTRAQRDYEQALKTGNKATIDEAKQRLELAQKVADATSLEVQAQTTAVQNLATGLKESEQDTVDGLNMVADGLKGFADGTLSGAFNGIQNMLNGLSKLNIGGKVGDAIGKLSDTLSSAGFIGQLIAAILSILDILKDGIGTLIANLLDTVFNAITGILQNILSLDFIGQIGGSLVKGIGGILNTVTFGGFNSLFGVGGNESEVAATSQALKEENERLRKSIDRLTDSMNNKSGISAIKDYEKAAAKERQYGRNLVKEIDNQMGYHSAHHSNNYYADDGYIARWNSTLNNLFRQHQNDYGKNSVGQASITGIGSIYSLTPEQLAVIRDYAPEFWKYLTEVGKYDKSEYWENAADAAGKVQEITESLYQNLTQMSFDSLKDNFLSSLMDMSNDWDDTLEDMMDNFEEMFRKAALNFALSSVNDKLKQFWEEWGERMKNGTELTQGDIAYYKQRYQALVEEGLRERDRIAQITGYKAKDEKEQSATANGIEKMTHDDAGVIEGRLTATQIAVEQGNTKKDAIISQMSVTNMTLADMRSVMASHRDIADETRSIMANSYLELREANEHLDKIEKSVSTIRESVDEMKDDIKDLK